VPAVLLRPQRSLVCDMVVFATGVTHNSELAREAGIAVGGLGGILTDDTMMTRSPDIYACGDCAEFMDAFTGTFIVSSLWSNAVLGGKITGSNIVGISRRKPDPMRLRLLTVFGLKICAMGYAGYALPGTAKKEVIGGTVSGGEYRVLLANGSLVGMQIVGTGNPGSLFPVIYKREKLLRVVQAIRSHEGAGGNPMFRSFFRFWRPFQAVDPGGS
ncbi:MAG: FAD-dependent oxidoreductase, partial [Syntrophales bacterium LBB04]|nr:FAD-dependent oxidoreductase [Syntrophales bacterium LBB04]